MKNFNYLGDDGLYNKDDLLVSPRGTLWIKDDSSLLGRRLATVNDFNLREDCKGFSVFFDRLMTYFDECKLYIPDNLGYLP